jgi:phage-related minor tail protein
MADVGSLAISLSIDDANFKRSMSQVDRSLKTLGQEMSIIRGKGKDWGNSLDGLSSKQKALTNILKLQEQKVQDAAEKHRKLAEEHGEGSVKAERQAAALNKLIAQYTRTETELNDVTQALDRQQREADQASSTWGKLQKSLGNAGSKMKDVGSSMKSIGSTMAMSVTLPIVGLGAAALKTASDFDSAQGLIQAKLGETGQRAGELADISKKLWKDAYGEDVKNAADNVALVVQNMQGLSDEEIKEVSAAAMDLEKVFGTGVNETTQAAGVIMANFGEEGTGAMDVLTAGLQKAGSRGEDLLDTFTEYSPQFAALGISSKDAMNLLLQGLDAGARNTDVLADSIKEFTIEAEQSGERVAKGYTKIGLNGEKMMANIAEGGDKANNAFYATIAALSAMENDVERNAAGVEIFGTKWEDVKDSALLALDPTIDLLGDVEGAAKEAGDAVKDNFGTRLTSTVRELQASLLPIGEELLDIAEDILPKLQGFADWFTGLSDGSQKAILAIGGLAAAAGPLLVVVGSVASGIGGLVTTVSAVSGAVASAGGAAAVLGSALTVLSGPIGWTIAGLAALTVGGIALAKEMKKPAIEVEIFSDKVSESTQKAVGSYLELDEQATVALNGLAWSQQTVTEEMAGQLIGTFQEMNDQILTEMKADHEEQLAATQDFFSRSNAMTAEEEAKIVAKVQGSQSEQQLKVEEGQARITEILTTAKDEKRSITEQEKAEINAIQEEMKVNAVTVMSENEAEQKAILERLKTESSEITAQQAAEVVKNATKQKDDVIKEANEQYDSAIAEIIRMRDESGVISAEQADKLIEEAKRQKDETVKKAEETHDNVVKEAKSQAKDHVNEVNWQTGEVLSKWESFKKKTGVKFDEMGKEAKKKWEDMSADVTSAAAKMVGDTIGELKDLKSKASGKLDEISDKFSGFKDDIVGFFKNMVLKIPTPSLPKLPQFSLETSTKSVFGKDITYPSGIDVTWHKIGGVFKDPVIFGNAGFGDVEEAIVPFEGPHAKRIASLIAGEMDKRVGGSSKPIIIQSIIDGKVVAESTYPDINRMLYRDQTVAERTGGTWRR